MANLSDQWQSIKSAPLPFVIATVFVSGVIWSVVDWRYGAKIDRLESEIEAANDKVEQAKADCELSQSRSCNQSVKDDSAATSASEAMAPRIENDSKKAEVEISSANFLSEERFSEFIKSHSNMTALQFKQLGMPFVGMTTRVVGVVAEVTEDYAIVRLDRGLNSACTPANKNVLLSLSKGDKVACAGKINSISTYIDLEEAVITPELAM